MPNNILLPSEPKELPSIITPRLVVRVARPNDLENIVRYINENRTFLQPWEPTRSEYYYTPSYWRSQISLDGDDVRHDRGVRFFLFDRQSSETEVRGVATFGNLVRGAAQYCTLGYAMAESAQGQGFMREALEEAALPFVFQKMGIHRIHANYLPRNERSGGLLRRLQFSIEGYARDYLLINGRWEDHILTSRTNPNWKAATSP